MNNVDGIPETLAAGDDPLEPLLLRTMEFEAALIDCFPSTGVVLAIDDSKHQLCRAACMVSTEHAIVLRMAFSVAAANSGSSLLRLQFEALLRGAWLLYAANEEQVGKLAQGLNLQSEQGAKNLPSQIEMLAGIQRHAPPGLSSPLEEFNLNSRHALNSFVHTGIHALRRTNDGFPVGLALKLLTFSNGLMHIAYRLLAGLSGSQRRVDSVTRLHSEFRECLPILRE